MASTSGTSSGLSTLIQNSGSESELQALMDERKRKRMISNRESARRSRMRKQKHLDDLTAQIIQLRDENHQIITRINFTTQHFMNLAAENSVLRAQANELIQRLQSLNQIISFLNNGSIDNSGKDFDDDEDHTVTNLAFTQPAADTFLNPFHLAFLNHPIMASADNMFQY